MAKKGRERYFSFIFIPDREGDPKSVTMNYTQGWLILILLVVLSVHIIWGAVGYFRIHRLKNIEQVLQTENVELKAKNQKIERIAKEFNQIRLTDQKIRKAFGGTLGLEESQEPLPETQPPQVVSQPVYTETSPESEFFEEEEQHVQTKNRLSFLSESSGDFFNPEYLPTLLPVEGFLTTHFQKGGWYVGRSHYGIDIAAKKGTVIRAAGAGTVLLSDWTPDFGNVIVISHGQGLFSYYAHAMRLLVTQGAQVRKGQSIALLGSSGISSAPHLHFEIWRNGEPLDPEEFVYAMHSKKLDKGT
jgi:murein DD-endopeptidase MepM/ murein hydrolase activator NlpD